MLQCKMQLAVLYNPFYFRGVVSSEVVRYSFKASTHFKKNFVRLIDSVLTVFAVHGKKLRNVSAQLLTICTFEPRAFPE